MWARMVRCTTVLLFCSFLSSCTLGESKSTQSSGSGNNIACQAKAVCVNQAPTAAATPTTSAPASPPTTTIDENGIHWVNSQFSAGSGLIINSSIEEGFGGCPGGSGYVYPGSSGITTAIPPGTGPKRGGKTWDQNPWAFGAVPAGPARIKIYLTGPADHAVVITGLQFHVLSRKPAFSGAWLFVSGQCGGGSAYHYAKYDFDAAVPYLRPYVKPTGESTDELRFPYTTTATDPAALMVDVSTDHTDCTWDLVLSWIDGGTAKTARIDDNGKPFELTSAAGMTQKSWLAVR